MDKLKLLCALLLILASLVSFSECTARKVKSETQPPTVEEEPSFKQMESLFIPPETLNKYNLIAFQVSERELFKTINFPVRIERDERNITEIRAGFPGKVDEVFADGINAQVEIGAPLFSISSPEILKLQQDYLNTLKKVIESPNQQEQFLADAEAYRQRLIDYNFNPNDLVNLVQSERPYSKFTFYSKVRGVIKTRRAAPGINVQSDTILFTIADLSDGIATGTVPAEYTDFLHIGMQGYLRTSQFPDQDFSGTVFSIEPGLSRSNVQLVYRNLPQVPKFDKTGRVTLIAPLGSYISIPKQAITLQNKIKTVYIPLRGGEFTPREIKTGLEGDLYIQVVSGLKEGEYVIANPAELLK